MRPAISFFIFLLSGCLQLMLLKVQQDGASQPSLTLRNFQMSREIVDFSCATITNDAGVSGGALRFGVAPLSCWAGVISQGGIERCVEWAIEQGVDTYTYSMNFLLGSSSSKGFAVAAAIPPGWI